MRPTNRFRKRVSEAFGAMVLTLMATVAGRIMEAANQVQTTNEFSLQMIAGLIHSFPGLVTLSGIIGATVIAGPFGFVGAILESIGATQLLYHQNEAGLWMIFFGAGLVTIGALIPWSKVLSMVLGSGSRRY